ncbi:MAG: molybdopterin oxidoreductase family protein [Acidobacteriota bacterium]
MSIEATSSTHYRACNLCEAICGLEIRVEDGEIVAIRGDAEDPFSRGHICPKAVALQDIYRDPDRLKHPVRRTADGWQRLGWDEAFDLVAERLRAVQQDFGRDAVGAYLGNPNVHNYGSILYGPPLLRALKSRNVFSATSIDQLPHHVCGYFMYGHQLLLPIPDIDRTDFFLVLGGNPAVSNGSLMTAPDVKKRLKAIRERGGRMVVIDPRYTETAKLADQHCFIRPGTDAFLLAALIHTVLDEGLVSNRLADLSYGGSSLETVRGFAEQFTPERVADATGLEAAAIRQLARDFATAPSAACYGRMGVSVQEFGTLCQWQVNVLNILTGNLDRPGGAMFTRPALDLLARPFGGGSYGRWHSRVRGLPEFAGELPVSAMIEELQTPGEGQVRALLTVAGNPVLSTPDGRRLEQALSNLDFMVSIDFYINETTRHADLILPPTSTLEHDHYDVIFHTLAIRNTARYSQPLFEPEADTRHDWQILHELRARLEEDPERLERGPDPERGPGHALDLGLRAGPWGDVRGANGLSLAALEAKPHGVDLGPLEPCLPDRLGTLDNKIVLVPEPILEDTKRLIDRLEELSEPASMVMIGRRQVRSNNSWMHNYPRLMRGKDRCTLLMHPDDAERLGVSTAAQVEVSSRVGSITAPLEITAEIMPGVVSLPHGWGHGREGTRLETARQHPGVSLNDLTDPARIDQFSGNASVNGLPVEIRPMPVT